MTVEAGLERGLAILVAAVAGQYDQENLVAARQIADASRQVLADDVGKPYVDEPEVGLQRRYEGHR
jgi:hypothetical protein